MDKRKILIIDDEKELVDMLTLRLRASGYEVVSAVDGQAGLAKASQVRPDLVMVDVVLPAKDGLSVCKSLKSDGTLGKVPVILITAKDQGDPAGILKATKADAILMKPLDPQQLLSKIKELIHKN